MQMQAGSTGEIEAIIRSLDQHIAATKTQGLVVAAQLLAMAKLELQMMMHRISDSELQEFCAAVEEAAEAASSTPKESTSATAPVLQRHASRHKRRCGD
jgi:hypothetical protein